MPIKTEPVPVHTEEAAADAAVVSEQVDAEKKEEEPKDAPEKQIPKAKAKRVSKKAKIETPPEPVEEAPQPAPQAALHAKSKAKSKAKSTAKSSAKETADLSQKTKCPICKRVVTTHCLLYTHKCPKAALDEKKKIPTVEESAPPPPKLERAQNTQREMKQWVEENPGEAYPYANELPVPEVFAPPPTFVETEGGGYLTIAERRVNHREALEQQYREYQFHKKQNQISHLRQFYR